MRQIILDTETTGLSAAEGHRIIEIGAIEMVNRRLTGKHFHHYINPQRESDPGALNIHGLTTQFLKDKPVISLILDDFLAFIQDAELVIHNAKFDLGFIEAELTRVNKKLENIRVVDTLLLARDKHPGQKNNLDALCKRYNVDNSKRDLHGALMDATLLAHVYLAMTGGQKNLLDEEENLSEITIQKIKTKKRENLIVISASEEEQTAHLAKLNSIKQCLWLLQEQES